jgi:hypothetical protein
VVGLGAALAVAAGGVGLAQFRVTQTPASGTAFVLGQIVDATTGRGLPGVLVVIAPQGAAATPIGELTEARPPTVPPPTAPGARRTLTAADGRFLFRDLPKGRFSISATALAYVAGTYGQLRPHGPGQPLEIDDGEKRGGVTITLWRNGSITGAVRDEHGEPAVGVNVECLRRVFTGGQRRFVPASTSVFTDDRGRYRVGNVPPGEYICGHVLNPTTVPVSVAAVSAAASEAGAPTSESRRMSNSSAVTSASGVRIGDVIYSPGIGSLRGPIPPPPDEDGRILAYAPQYYGGAATTAQASLITLKPGEERGGIDMQLKLVPTVRVGGRLIGPNGPVAFLGLTLVPASGNDVVSEGQATFARTTSDASGAFMLLGIPSGDYVLKGRLYPRPLPGGNPAAALDETSLWLAAPITAGPADTTNLTLTVRAGLRAIGRVEFVGARTPPNAAAIQRIGVRLQMAEGRTSSPIALDGRVRADSTFKTAGYPAGRYIANVLPNTVPQGWSVRSIMANGRDVSVEPLELTDADVTGLLVTFTDRTTTLSGTVTRAGGPDPTAEIVVFPADSLAWKEIGAVSRRRRVERVNRSGSFSITGLPPGDYFVAAAAGSRPGDRQDPAFLAALMPDATRVTLGDAGSATVQLAVKR